MTAPTGYQPYAITKFQTGQFQYYQPWMSPDDAFNPLVNAYVFRGVLQKRAGSTVYGLTGSLRYTNNEIVASGDGGSSYNGIISNFPVESPVTITAMTASGIRSATATGTGIVPFIGALASSGSIDTDTGVWSLGATANIAADIPIVMTYTFTDNLTETGRPIMMITEFIDDVSNAHTLVVADTRRVAVFNTITQLFDPIQTFCQTIWVANATDDTFAINLGWTNIAPYSVSITDGTFTITDEPSTYPDGGFTTDGNLNPIDSSSIDYSTGDIIIDFTAYGVSAPVTITITASLQGDYFTGTFRNLFNYSNWRATDNDQAHLYMTNNVDRVTLYDGTCLSRPPLAITLAHYNAFINDIKTTLDVKPFQQSLLLIRPTTVGAPFPDAQMIRASAPNNPIDFVEDVPGHGSQVSATTGDWLFSASYLRDAIVVEFEDSCFVYRATSEQSRPFRFFKINSTLSTNAPYGSIEYDTNTTSMGAKGLCQCDGVNKARYDIPDAIDLYEDIDENNFDISQGKRFDEIQQSWMIYSSDNKDEVNTNCDKVIVYNWQEGTWSTYEIALSCIGSAKTYQDTTWNSFTGLTWAELAFTWSSLVKQDLVPWMLGGDINGIVYYLNDDTVEYDKVSSDDATSQLINSSILSKRWNPFIQDGQKATFGYVDFYYRVGRNSYVDEQNPFGKEIVLYLNWFANNSDQPALTQSMTLDSPAPTGEVTQDIATDELYAWKRMYVNLTGQFLQLEIQSSADFSEQGQFQIAGMVLWAKPAGRLTPGRFL